ncbi:MAG: type VI secretion system tip protein TssI/VgrG [bacterium]|jgi:type VI secretion system VgrG family protein|nr:type VI secretion system tip protein VgrG [Betaproteobacteria bacterium]
MRKTATLDPQNRIEFTSRGVTDDTFGVVRFQGEEGLSRLYRFEIELVAERADLDLDAMLANDVTLAITNRGTRTLYHGVLEEFEELHQKNGDTFYRAVLVPKLWQLSLFRVNEVYVDRSTPEIIEAVLQEGGLTPLDYELALSAEYTPWTHLCEYQESHFDFISRLMERDGIYYYFDQGSQRAKLVITDQLMRHKPITTQSLVYEPATGLQQNGDRVSIFALLCRQKRMPEKVILMDYNYRKPSLEIRSEAVVDPKGRGEVYFYGEHADTVEESTALSKLRAEEIACRRQIFQGESNVAQLCPGFLAEVTGHFRSAFNQRYLVTEVSHEGSQAGEMLAGEGLSGGSPEQARQESFYRNTFGAIPGDVQFRPERLTPKPRIHGTMNAVIDAESSGADPELDEAGRYKVKVTFDRTKKGEAKASQSVRMATPYAGSDHGIHYPLRKGTEVLLTFIDGDPNRPIIAGAVPNADTPSVANSENERSVVTRLRGGMETTIGPSRTPQMAGVGAQARAYFVPTYPDLSQSGESLSEDDLNATFGTHSWEVEQGWQNDAFTFDLDRAPGSRTVNLVNNVLHSNSASCERYLGPVITTIVGDNNLTVRGNVYTYIGKPDARVKNDAETFLRTYSSDINTEEGGSDNANDASKAFAKMFQWMGDNLSSTRTDTSDPGSSVTYIEGGSRSTIRGTNVSIILGDQDTTVQSDSFNKYIGRTNNFYAGNTFLLYLGTQETVNIGGKLEMNLGAEAKLNISISSETKLAFSFNFECAKTVVNLQDSEATVNQLKARVTTTESAVTDTKAQLSQVRTSVSSVGAQVNTVKNKVNEISNKANEIQNKVNDIRNASTLLTNKVAEINSGAITLIA